MPRRRKKVYPVNQETVSNTAHQQRLLIAEKLKKLEQEKSASVKHGNKGKHKKKCHDTKFKRPKYDNKTEKETRKNSVEESWAKGNADEDSEKVSVAKVDIDAESDKETDVKENQVKDSKVHSVTIINPNNDDDVECEANDDVVADSDVESDIKDTPNEDSDVDRETIHPPYRDSDVECEANDNVVAESDVESDIEDKPVEDSDVDSDTIHPPYRDSDVDSKVNDNLVEDRDDTENQIEDIDVDSNANDTSNKDSDKVSEAKVNVDKDGDIEFEAKKHTDEDCEVENETKEKPLDDKEPNRSKNKGTKHYTHMYRRNKRDWSHSEQSMTGEEESKDLSDNDFENKNEKQWSQMESGWGENGVSYPKEMSYEGNSDTNYKTYSYESHDDDDDETRWERNTFTNRDFSNFNLGNEKSGTEKEDRTKTRKNSDQFQEMLSDDDSDLKSGNVEKCEIESESQTNSTSSESDHKAQSVRTEFGRTFNITIEQDEWNTVKPTKFEKIMKPNWTNIFANAFNKKVPGCVLKFHYHKVNGNLKRAGSYFNAKASCKHPGCGIFMLKINAKPRKAEKKVMVDVHAIEPIVKHTPELIKKRKLAMTNRQKAKQKLMHQTASTIHYSEFGKMTNEEIKEGNYTKCQSEEVLRKAKSEWNLHEALHQDPFTELVISQEIYREEDEDSKHTIGYIQEISYQPFMVITYMEQSIQAAKYNIKYGNGVFHLDATGTVVKKIHPDRKVLYYSLIMHTDGVIVPVLEYLTDHQGTHYISRPLLNFQGLLGQRYRPKRIEVDFSWALIHSVLLSFNCLKINEYLELCFELDEEQMKNGITVVHVCCVHMLRAVREHLKDKVKDKAMRELLLRLWAVLQNTKTLNGARKVWKIMCLVFARKYEGRRVENAIAAMNEMVMTASFDELDGNFCMEDDQSTHISTHDQAQKTGIRALSPYKKFFLVPDEEADEDRPVNTYYNRDVMEYLSNNYMPLYPLWSGCFLEDDLTRDSNAPVEAWMKVLKKDIFQGARNLRIGQFIRTLKPVVKGRLRKCLGVVKKQPKEKRKKVNKQKNQNVDMGDNLNKAKETWQRRNRGKSRTSFFYSPAKEVPVPKPKRKGRDAFEIHKKKNQDHEIPGIGIRNISNTCWLNAAVQGMAALSSFNCKGNDSVSIETQKVLSDLRGYDGGQRKALDTVNLREAIRDNLDNFHIGRQEDSAELIHYFMGENVDNDCHDFTVEITYTKRCLQCNTQSPKTETTTLLNIEVPVRREVSVNDCLDEHCKGEVIRAENAIYCRRCFN